jgi:hypothetical protein
VDSNRQNYERVAGVEFTSARKSSGRKLVFWHSVIFLGWGGRIILLKKMYGEKTQKKQSTKIRNKTLERRESEIISLCCGVIGILLFLIYIFLI